MPVTVLVAIYGDELAWTIPHDQVARLRQRFPLAAVTHATNPDELRALAPAADVAFSWRIDVPTFAIARRLRWIHTPAAGVGSMLTPELTASQVVVTNSRGVHAPPVAEHVVAVTLAWLRRLPEAARAQAAHRWAQNELAEPAPRLLRDVTIGIVGLGAIGSEVARVASLLGARVVATRQRMDRTPPAGVAAVLPASSLDELLAQSDVVVLAAPLTHATRGLIGAAQVARMKHGALLVNVGRGRLVDEDALVAALRGRTLGGAALDVVAHEPLDPASPLWDLPNVFLTPHTAGLRADFWPVVTDLFADNLERFLAGQPLRNVVDKDAGY